MTINYYCQLASEIIRLDYPFLSKDETQKAVTTKGNNLLTCYPHTHMHRTNLQWYDTMDINIQK